MIKLTETNGRLLYLAPAAIASVVEAGASSAWHGTRSHIRTFDGQAFSVRETPEEVDAAIVRDREA